MKVIGDLVEHFSAGRSGWWFWRQVVVDIVVGNGREVWTHKWLALRAVAVGWIASYGLSKIYWVAITMTLPATAVGPQPATLMNALVLMSVAHTAMVRASAGWLVGRLHRPFPTAMVLVFLCSLLALDLPWLGRRAVDAFANPQMVTPFLYQLVAMIVTVVSVLIGGVWSSSSTLNLWVPARPGRRPA